jgi:phosphatidylglycerophosphatase A
MKTIIKLISTGFYIGYSPVAPGTVGSLLGVVIYLYLSNFGLVYLFTCLFLVIIGFLVSGKAEKIYNEKDCGKIVIDEIAAMCMVYIALPKNMWIVIAGFLLFRIFDIMKPYPIKNAEKLKGSSGIMLDDIIAAVYANLILQVMVRLPLNIFS